MRVISAKDMDAVLEWRGLIETLRQAYRSQTVYPPPSRFDIDRSPTGRGCLQINPAWTNFTAQGHTDRGYIGLGVDLDLLQQDAASVASGVYMLFSGRTGAPIALLDGSYMNLWRQAGIHALAASYLAREDISRLLIIGTHPLLAYLLSAYAEIRDIRSVLIYGADDALCRRLASQPALSRMTIGTANDLSETVSGADMITVLQGPVPDISLESVGPGLHIDVIVPELAIPQALKEDARIFISDNVSSDDTGTLEIAATLHELAQGDKAGRRFYSQLTLFQSSKASGLADLATGGHIFLRT